MSKNMNELANKLKAEMALLEDHDIKAYDGNLDFEVAIVTKNNETEYEHTEWIKIPHLIDINLEVERSEDSEEFADNRLVNFQPGEINSMSITATFREIHRAIEALITGANVEENEDGKIITSGSGDQPRELAIKYTLTKTNGERNIFKGYSAQGVVLEPSVSTKTKSNEKFYTEVNFNIKPLSIQMVDKDGNRSNIIRKKFILEKNDKIEEIAPYLNTASKIDKDGKETPVISADKVSGK